MTEERTWWYNVMHAKYWWIYTWKGAKSWYSGPISYWVSAGLSVSNVFLFLFALHKTMDNRRLHTHSRRVKQRSICASLCRQEITRGGGQFLIKCIHRRAAGIFHLLNLWLGGINVPLHYINAWRLLSYGISIDHISTSPCIFCIVKANISMIVL